MRAARLDVAVGAAAAAAGAGAAVAIGSGAGAAATAAVLGGSLALVRPHPTAAWVVATAAVASAAVGGLALDASSC